MARIDRYNYFPFGPGAISELVKCLDMDVVEETRRIYYIYKSHRYGAPLLPRPLGGSTDANQTS